MPGQLRIRRFHENDLPIAEGLREIAGWNQTAADWERLWKHEPAGCFVAEWNGVTAGTVTTTRHGDHLGWIGMMLVHPEYRRRGIATELMTTAMDYLAESGVRTIALDATPEGAPVYERLGFRAAYGLHRWRGVLNGMEQATRESLPLPLNFDVVAFGADRSQWLGRLAEGAVASRLKRDKEGAPAAFGMWRRGMRANYLGPASAVDASAGRAVIEDLLGSIEGETFWDFPDANTEATLLAEAQGFERLRPLLRMWTGEAWIDDAPENQFGLGDPGTG